MFLPWGRYWGLTCCKNPTERACLTGRSVLKKETKTFYSTSDRRLQTQTTDSRVIYHEVVGYNVIKSDAKFNAFELYCMVQCKLGKFLPYEHNVLVLLFFKFYLKFSRYTRRTKNNEILFETYLSVKYFEKYVRNGRLLERVLFGYRLHSGTTTWAY